MRGDLIRVLSSVEEKANELRLDGYEPDVVLFGREAYEFVREQVNEEFGGEEEVSELSGLRVRVVEELGGRCGGDRQQSHRSRSWGREEVQGRPITPPRPFRFSPPSSAPAERGD